MPALDEGGELMRGVLIGALVWLGLAGGAWAQPTIDSHVVTAAHDTFNGTSYTLSVSTDGTNELAFVIGSTVTVTPWTGATVSGCGLSWSAIQSTSTSGGAIFFSYAYAVSKLTACTVTIASTFSSGAYFDGQGAIFMAWSGVLPVNPLDPAVGNPFIVTTASEGSCAPGAGGTFNSTTNHTVAILMALNGASSTPTPCGTETQIATIGTRGSTVLAAQYQPFTTTQSGTKSVMSTTSSSAAIISVLTADAPPTGHSKLIR